MRKMYNSGEIIRTGKKNHSLQHVEKICEVERKVCSGGGVHHRRNKEEVYSIGGELDALIVRRQRLGGSRAKTTE